MKILDKYVAKNFLIGYAIAFGVLIGMRITIDLFTNLDEFTSHANLNSLSIIANIFTYYSLQSTLYFRDFAAMITVVAAAFSLGKMVRYNELIAMMASGISLKRVITPIVLLAIVFSGLLIIDQELIIPALGPKLVRSSDDIPGKESYKVWFITDASGSLISAKKFYADSSTFEYLIVVTRSKKPDALIWEPTGIIEASKATYDFKKQTWLLTDGFFTPIPKLSSHQPGRQNAVASRTPLFTYHTDITPTDIPIRRKSELKSLLSSMQLSQLASQGTQLKDLANLYSQKHFRITDPIMNLVMLLVCLPVLVCRDPKSMKSAVAISFAITAASLVVGFGCRILATEDVFGRIVPELWAWLPVFIFAPIAFLEIDSMKT
ncbi:MAG: LptF/LptG family permease [Sedimentisphaerales bacterium]|jgi:lipopolysaccharide export system permease protein